jgi:putative DNA primase/helicase
MKQDFYANATPFADIDDDTTDGMDLPYGFTTDDTALWYQAESDDGKTPKKMRVCSPIGITYRVRDTQGHYGLIAEFDGRDGKHVRCFVPDTLLHKKANEVAAHIADLGLEIETNNVARERLQCFLNKQTASFAVYVQQSGWVKNNGGEDAYALPSGEIIGADGIIMRPDRCMQGCQPAGTLKDWQDNVASYARNNDRLAFSISCGFAAPLMQQVNVPSGGFHWLGFSQSGKTTLLSAASSVIGMAHLGEGYVRSWRGTDNAMEAVAAAHNDSLLPLDEMSQAPPKDVAQMSYQFGNGGGKSRMKADGSMRHTYTWRTLILSTGEETPEDKIKQAGQEANAGVTVRLASIPAVAGKLGVFDTIHEFASAKELADHLRSASRKYYGTALRAFITEYIGRKDAYNETIIERCNTFMQRHLKGKDAAGQAWSVCHRFALVAVAGELATEFGILPWDKGDATRAADTCFAAWSEERGHLGLEEEEKIITAFRTYIGAYQMSRFLDLDDRDARIVTEMVGYKRSEVGRTDFYILPEQMSKVLPGMNVKNAMKMMDAQGFLVREKRRETQKYRLKPLRNGMDEMILTYRISGAILTGE